jgi:CheY-like chemotaxis protein
VSDVLVVDDAPDIRRLARLLLEDDGHSVREAGTAEAALILIQGAPPDVILLDLRLPGTDGWAMLEDLRQRGLLESIRVVLFSAHVNPKEFSRATQVGASGYLTKPFTAEQLLATVAAATA